MLRRRPDAGEDHAVMGCGSGCRLRGRSRRSATAPTGARAARKDPIGLSPRRRCEGPDPPRVLDARSALTPAPPLSWEPPRSSGSPRETAAIQSAWGRSKAAPRGPDRLARWGQERNRAAPRQQRRAPPSRGLDRSREPQGERPAQKKPCASPSAAQADREGADAERLRQAWPLVAKE